MDKSLRCMTGEVLLVSNYYVSNEGKRGPFVLCEVFDQQADVVRPVDVSQATKFVGAVPDDVAFASLMPQMSINVWCRVDEQGNVNPRAEFASPNYR